MALGCFTLVRMVSGEENDDMSIDLTFGLVVLALISWQFSIWWRRYKAITTFVENRKDYQHLLIRPVGVESPVHEICVAILENLDNKRFRFSIESKKIEHTQVSTYIHTSVLIYDTHKKVSMSFTESYIPGSLYYFIDGLSVGDIAITLSQEEGNYVKSVYDYVRQHLKLKKDKLAKLKEQRHRRAITKLYSEVIPNDQTN